MNYRLEDDALWRDSYAVLDRAANTEPTSVLLLEGVEDMQLRFLAGLDQLQVGSRGLTLDTSDWQENWVGDPSAPNSAVAPPSAVEIVFQLNDWEEIRRLYALPPL